MKTPQEKRLNLKTVLRFAKVHETVNGKRTYVLWSVAKDEYIFTETMPLMGEWYSTDGIRHG